MVYNILYLNRASEIGGAEQSLLLLLSDLNQDRFSPTVILPKNGPLANSLRALDIETIFIPLNRLRWRNPFPYFKTLGKLTALLKDRKFDLVHSNIEFCSQYVSVAAKLSGTPCICHVRNILNKISFWEYTLWLPDVLIANSQATLESIKGQACKTQKVELIYNGVDLKKFIRKDDKTFRDNLGINEDTFLLGVVGRINPRKGHHTFISSLKIVLESKSNFCALIVGNEILDGAEEYLLKLKHLVSELRLSDKVIFTGFVKDMSALFDSLDLLVLPSLAEAFGRVLIEAMAMEKPVVATRSGGAIEVVDDGVTGILVKVESPDSLAEAILRIMTNKTMAEKMGRMGRKRVELLFNNKQNITKTENVYLNILESGDNEKTL